MKNPLETGIDDSREMLSKSHFSTGCYQHNICFQGGTMLFFRRFQGRISVFQGGARRMRNARLAGKKMQENLRGMIVTS
jgi:hypothetical protein